MVLHKVIAFMVVAAATMAPLVPIPVDIVELTSLEWEEGTPLPNEIQSLHGERVSLTGYMHQKERGGTTEFLFVADQRCQCGGVPPPNKFVLVRLENGAADFRPERVQVVGKFYVGEKRKDGFVTSIYRMKGNFVR